MAITLVKICKGGAEADTKVEVKIKKDGYVRIRFLLLTEPSFVGLGGWEEYNCTVIKFTTFKKLMKAIKQGK